MDACLGTLACPRKFETLRKEKKSTMTNEKHLCGHKCVLLIKRLFNSSWDQQKRLYCHLLNKKQTKKSCRGKALSFQNP